MELSPVDYVVRKGWQYKKRGAWIDIRLCPFCKGGRNNDLHTFAIHYSDGNYVCKRGSCNERGSFAQLQERFGDKSEKSYQAPARSKVYFKQPKSEIIPPTEKVYGYLNIRGFARETVDACGIMSDGQDNVVFVYKEYPNDKPCMLKFRHSHKVNGTGQKKAWREEGGKAVLWRLEVADPSVGPLVITFGEYDAMTCVQAGVPNSCSVPSGDDDLGWIQLNWDSLEKFPDIILWPDNDKSGQRSLQEVSKRLGIHRVRVVESAYKDANEMFYRLVQFSRTDPEIDPYAVIRQTVEEALPYPFESLIRLADIQDEPVIQDGILSGLSQLDKVTGGFRGGELSLWSGDNHAGKTTGVLGLCAVPSFEERKPVFLYSGEMKKGKIKYWTELIIAGDQWLIKQTSPRTGRDYWDIGTNEVRRAIHEWYYDYCFLYDKQGGTTEANLFDAMEFAYKKYGCRTFILDNLMIMTLQSNEKDEYRSQGEFTSKCKQFADDFDSHVHLIAHSRKQGDPLFPPTKASIKGASEISNLADNVGAFWRIPRDIPPETLTGQQRNMLSGYDGVDTMLCWFKTRDSGEQTNIKLKFEKSSKRFGAMVPDKITDNLDRRYGWEELLVPGQHRRRFGLEENV